MLNIFLTLIDFLPFTNLSYGLIGGLVSAFIGWFGKGNTIRWMVSFALMGVFSTYIFLIASGTKALAFHQDVRIFVPLFAGLGVLGSGVFKYYVDEADWTWLVLFPLMGIIAAALSQSPGIIPWLIVLGSISGGVAWYLANSRLRWVFLFAGLGIILALFLLTAGHWHNYNFLIASLGGILGGIAGWFTADYPIRWMIALTMLGMLTGSVVEYTYLTEGLLPLLAGGMVGGIVGLIIKTTRYREALACMVFGGIFLSSIKVGWDVVQFLETMWRMG